jgi:tetratricopeptide (TPR) repeat protein
MLAKIRSKIITMRKPKGWSAALSNDILTLQATYNYGVSLFHLGQDWAYSHAIESFKKLIMALSSANTSTTIEIKELAQGSLACTYAKLAERKVEQKEKFCNLAFEQTKMLLDNTTNNAVKALAAAANGLAYLSLDKGDLAIEAFNLSLELDPNITALLGLGEAYRKRGNYEDAIDAYQRANKLTSEGGYASYRLGNLFREIGNKEKAAEAYKQAPALSVARLSLGKLYLEYGELETALEEFRNAVRLNQKNSEALVNIAWTILEMQNEDEDLLRECIDAAKRSVQIDRGSTNEWHRRTILAFSLIAARKTERALKEAQLGFELAPDKAQVKFCVALCEFHLGRKDDARKILLEILHSDERGLWRTRAERLMREMNKEG